MVFSFKDLNAPFIFHGFPLQSCRHFVRTNTRNSHLFMKKSVYKVIIAVIWLTAILRECAQIAFMKVITRDRKTEILMNFTIYMPYYFISLLIICVCYTTIFLKIRYSSPPQPLRSSVIIKERQLTKTLFVVTVTSLLTLLPVPFLGLETFTHDPVMDRSSSLYCHIKFAVTLFFLANSLAFKNKNQR